MNNAVNIKIIDNYIKENKLNKTKFCKLCKISVYTFNKIMTNDNCQLIALFKIAKTMSIQIWELFA